MKRTPNGPKHKRPKKKTRNPLSFSFDKIPGFPPAGGVIPIDIQQVPYDDAFARMGADLMISAALVKATPNDKMLIAMLIPELLKILHPKKKRSLKPLLVERTGPKRRTKPNEAKERKLCL